MNTGFKIDISDDNLRIPDELKLIIKDRHDAAVFINWITKEISKSDNKEITINLVGEYVRIEED